MNSIYSDKRGDGWEWGRVVSFVDNMLTKYCEICKVNRAVLRAVAGIRADSLSKALRRRDGRRYLRLGPKDQPLVLARLMAALIRFKIIATDEEIRAYVLEWPEEYVSRKRGVEWVIKKAKELSLDKCPIEELSDILVTHDKKAKEVAQEVTRLRARILPLLHEELDKGRE